MTALEPVRARPRAFWADMRFFLGIVLVAASVAGVWFVVSASRQTVPVFAAARTIVPGEAVSGDDVRVVDVALGQVGGAYLDADALTDGLVAVRTIESGELVPQSAVGDAAAAHTTSVVLRSAVDVPGSVEAGTVVEVWAAPQIEGGYDEPRILVADATVVSVTRDDSMIGAGSAALELVIARSEVAAMLAAMADEAALSVVPTTGATR
ncbi:SAF domain-containing protein [Microbacterium pygmaeum]|nr:SAF domain-containing protein [Microbacterium pygmaeum]